MRHGVADLCGPALRRPVGMPGAYGCPGKPDAVTADMDTDLNLLTVRGMGECLITDITEN